MGDLPPSITMLWIAPELPRPLSAVSLPWQGPTQPVSVLRKVRIGALCHQFPAVERVVAGVNRRS